MLKNFTRLMIIIIITVLQTTIFQLININNVNPNLFIITIVSISVLRGRNEGIIYAVSFGLIQDILFGSLVGYFVLIYLLVAGVTGYLYRNFYAESVVIPLIAIGASSLGYNLIIYFTTYLLRGKIDILYYLFVIILPELTYTVVIAIVLYRLYIIYSHFIDDYEKDKRKGDNDLYEGNL